MGLNGSGLYTRTDGTYTGGTVFAQQKAAAVKIIASRLDTEAQDMADALSTALYKDGQQTATANQPMGGFLHTNVGSATARTNYARADQVQDGALMWAGTTAGAGNTYTANLTPAITAYAGGMRVVFKADKTNTGSATLNLNGVGAITLQKYNAQNLAGGEILQNGIYEAIYDAGTTRFLLINPSKGQVTWSPSYGAEGSMTYTSVTTTLAEYRQEGKHVFFRLRATGTTGGTGDPTIKATLPVTAVDAYGAFACEIVDPGDAPTTTAGYSTFFDTSTLAVRKYSSSNWKIGAGVAFIVQGEYRAA